MSATGPTDKQVRYALALLAEAGYRTDWMDSSFKALGAKMAERSGRVEDWLRSKPRHEVSRLIDLLSAEGEQ